MRLVACGLAAFLLSTPAAHAEMSGGKVKIGVLTDLSGPYEQNSGAGSVEAANSDDPKVVLAKMREMPVNDAFTPDGRLRADGRMVHDGYLVQIKSPAESKGEWDLPKLVSAIPGDKAFRPLEAGGGFALAH